MFPWLAALALTAIAPPQPVETRHQLVFLSETSWARAELPDGRIAFTQTVAAPFNQAILSWNLEDGWASGEFSVVASGVVWASRAYSMGTWSLDGERGSVKGERDEFGHMDTDTLMLGRVANRCTVRVVATPKRRDSLPGYPGLAALALTNTGATPPQTEFRPAWGTTLEPPRRPQMAYQNGGVLCSPTALSMVLGHWARVLRNPFVDRDMPSVQRGVYDTVYKGCGNWPFNTAYAGSVPGMRAVVGRFDSLGDLERSIASGFPVVCSISSTVIKGGAPEANDGHLVVLVGFTPEGQPVFNDPGRNVVRMTYDRENFRKAWATSENTVYLIWPLGYTPPWI